MVKRPGKARNENVLENPGPQVLSQARCFPIGRLWQPPQPDKLKEGSPFPLNRIFHAHLSLQKILQELKVCQKPTAEGSQAVKQ